MERDNGIDPYWQSGVSNVDHRNLDVAGDDHPFGDEPKEWEADLRPLLQQFSEDLYDSWTATVREYLNNAETACLKVTHYLENPEESPFDDMVVDDSYEPKIIVTWDKSEKKLKIKDNGIGMAAVEVDEVFRQIGRSAARDLGTMSGAFGLGALSFLKFIGSSNSMIMVTHSRLNDDNAAYLTDLSGVEPIRGKLDNDDYGTQFSLDQKENDMDIRSAVETHSKYKRVPVLYRELDENGVEVFNEDWGDRRLYDSYSPGKYCESITVAGGFEAYMAEEATGRTLLLSSEIDRSDQSSRSLYDIDIRLLDESGKIVKSSNGNEGLMPISENEYEKMLLDARPDYITDQLLSNRDVTAQVGRIDGEEVYIVSEELLESDQPLPRAEYVTETDSVDEFGPEKVIMGKHEGRIIVSEDEWKKMPEGRATYFIPEDEVEDFDVDSGEGDLCLPEPTTDRSSLKQHPEFWKYIAERFNDRYDDQIEEYRQRLRSSDDKMKTVRSMDAPTVSDLR